METYLTFAQKSKTDQPEVVLTLMDYSGSMDLEDYRPTRLEGAIKANEKLIQTKAKIYPNDKVGIIAFHDKACLLHPPAPLAAGVNSLCQSLKTYKDGGGTNFTAALKLAEQVFSKEIPNSGKPFGSITKFLSDFLFESAGNSPGQHNREGSVTKDNITQRVILLTDGGHTDKSSPIPVARRLKNAGVLIECIGIAGNRKNVDEALLRQIASVDERGQPRYCFIGDTETLLLKYECMAHHIRAL